jgi:hypothetical protein
MEDDFENESIPGLAEDAKLVGHDALAVKVNAPKHPTECLRAWPVRRQDLVLLGQTITRVHHPVGQIAIVREQQKAFRISIEPADRVNPLLHVDELHNSVAVTLVVGRGNVPCWLVEHVIDQAPLRQGLAINADPRPIRVNFGAKHSDHFAVDRNPAGANEILRAPAGTGATGGEDALKTFKLGDFGLLELSA